MEKHGMYKTRIYCIWSNMKQRCSNPNRKEYKNYGGREIKVCEDWNKFINFKDWAFSNGYDEKLELDRIDNNGNYEPSNCRFISHEEQQFNKRNNHLITYKGETLTIMEMSKKYNIPYQRIQTRINKLKWSVNKAIETPVQKQKRYIIGQLNENKELIKKWGSMREIERELNFPHNLISKATRTHKKYKGFYWEKLKEEKKWYKKTKESEENNGRK